MQITVPEDIGGDLRKMEGVGNASLSQIIPGKSKAGKPKATIKWILTDELDGNAEGDASTVGEPVLETFSLQPQALWKLNELYKQATGERIPQGDYDPDSFMSMLEEALVGKEFSLVLELVIPDDGSSTETRTEVTERTYIG